MGKQKTRWIVTPGLLHEIKKFENLYRLVKREEREKDHRIPVMICGPTGVGKSLFLHIFQQLYAKENNSGGEVVRINCASFSEELLLSEIFGHIKGSFTGATRNRTGHIRKADKGVLILEEIGELSPLGQARLLTFIEDGYFFRVGSEKQERADVQIVATTNRKREDFRDDFWNRL
ncbi:MAG: sigma 54-interacting transcriptional regulator [Deltaproteobacteria bacterium]|nr:MAG: sigma 54-interacting transcriptional regulator [Deltaproteobacteria bacterium]